MILFVAVQLPVCMADSSSNVFIYYLVIMELVPFFIIFNLIGFTSAVAYKCRESLMTSECRVETNAETEANTEEAMPRREAEQDQKSRDQRPDQRREQSGAETRR